MSKFKHKKKSLKNLISIHQNSIALTLKLDHGCQKSYKCVRFNPMEVMNMPSVKDLTEKKKYTI